MLNHKTFFPRCFMLKIKHSQNINVRFLIRFFVLYVSVFCAVVWAGEWCSAQPTSSTVLLKTQMSTEKPQRGRAFPVIFLYLCMIPGGKRVS